MLAEGKQAVGDGVFLNAQNWQTVRRIVSPLRAMGIPAAAILDFDIISQGPGFRELLTACEVPPALVNSITTLRGQVWACYNNSIALKRDGLNALVGDDAIACRSLLDELAKFGIFLVPVGEIEMWLSYLGVQASKQNWLSALFERMGADTEAESYVRPQPGDVWDFMLRVGAWIRDPSRLGMPVAD
jgi:hypothetical protein